MDVVTLAHTARENLARGLGALQTPGIPPEIMQSAEAIAHAMSALHRIENTRGVGSMDAGPAALNSVRQALAQLQGSGVRHVALDQAVEAIASSLGMVHQLSVLLGQASVMPSPPTQPSNAYQSPPEPRPQVAVVGQAPPGYGAPQAANPVAATQLAPSWQDGAQAAAPAWQQPQAVQPAQAWQQPPPVAAPGWQNPGPAAQPPAYAPAVAAPPGADILRVNAELGAHSTTNFYKGLSGNDVIDSGGIFIATYNLPPVGTRVLIKVTMPGGYEFEALGEVRWTRDSPSSGAESPPGFGAQFTQISPEARQLVYRYVRNREPLFHDDF